MNKKLFNNEKILITGGSGFIGSNFTNYLIINSNCKIINLDKMTYASNKKFLIKKSKNYKHKKVDICNYNKIKKIIFDFKPNKIIHLAAESHVDRSIKKRNAFIKTNYIGTYNLLENSLNYWKNLKGLKKNKFRFLFVSTDEVYGDNKTKKPFSEDYKFAPSSAYSATKAGADLLAYSYFKTFKFPVLISRSSNNFGPFQNNEKFIPTIINSILNGRPVNIYGKGDQIRNWIYVDENIKALVMIIKKGKIGEAYNVACKNSYKNIKILEMINNYINKKINLNAKITSKKNLINYIPDRLGHDNCYSVSYKKLKNKIGWKMEAKFIDSLQSTIDWYIKEKNK